MVAINTLQWPRREVVNISGKKLKNKPKLSQKTKSGEDFVLVEVPPFGYSVVKPVEEVKNPVEVGMLFVI